MNSLEDDDAEEEEAKKTLEAGGALMHEHRSLYKTVELRTGYIHEVIIPNQDPKSVLTWDFDVMRSDLHFTLYRATKELPPKTGKFRDVVNCSLLETQIIFPYI